MYAHLKDRHTNKKTALIKSILKENLDPIIFKLFENLSNEESRKKEIEIINQIGRLIDTQGPLVNVLNTAWEDYHTGKTYKEIYGERWEYEIDKRLKGLKENQIKNAQLRKGKTFSKEWKDKLSISQNKRYETSEGPFKGKTHSEETKNKMRKSKNVGKANPQFGSYWITNGFESKKIKDSNIPKGWYKGRKIKFIEISANVDVTNEVKVTV